MKKFISLFIFSALIVFYFSLNRKEWIHKENIIVDNRNLPADSSQRYFPEKSFHNILIPWIGSKHNEWYSSELFKMKEPILFNGIENKEIYRFTWLRSFNNPIIVRIEKKNNDYKLYWKVGSDSKNYQLIVDSSKSITKTEWDSFKWQLRKALFWRMWSVIPSFCKGMDGSEYILEGSDNYCYHVVNRWSPDDTRFRKCCLHLLRMTGIKDIGKNKYSEKQLLKPLSRTCCP